MSTSELLDQLYDLSESITLAFKAGVITRDERRTAAAIIYKACAAIVNNECHLIYPVKEKNHDHPEGTL